MSEENVDVVRRGWDAALANPPDWDALDALVDPQHESITLLGRVEGSNEARGPAGWRQFKERFDQTGNWSVDINEVLPAPDGRVVVIAVFRMQARQSGVKLDAARGIVQTVRDGKLVRTEVFATPEKALEAAGLSE